MTSIEAARKVYEEKQVHLLRPRKDAPGQYDVKDAFQGKKKGWFYLDLFTASAIVKVYNAINEQNKEKLVRLPIERIAKICFQLAA